MSSVALFRFDYRRTPRFCVDARSRGSRPLRAYGRIYATLQGSGHPSRRRFADLLIGATALAHALPLYTRKPADFTALARLITVNTV